MTEYEKLRKVVAKGLKKYLGVPVVKGNQVPLPEKYPYCVYNITIISSANNGTYGEYPDGISRKPTTLTMSVSTLSADDAESVFLANKAYEWIDHVGRTYLNDNGVIVQELTDITNRDNFLTTDYEYKKGFDVVFTLFNEVERPTETIKTATLINE